MSRRRDLQLWLNSTFVFGSFKQPRAAVQALRWLGNSCPRRAPARARCSQTNRLCFIFFDGAVGTVLAELDDVLKSALDRSTGAAFGL